MADAGRITHLRLMHRGDDGLEFNADDVPILDAGSLLVATNVEDALQELATDIGAIGSPIAGDVTYDPSATVLPLTTFNLQDVIDELDGILAALRAKDQGYTAHGGLGSTETFDAATGWHSGTLNADCTFTFTGATSGVVASLVLELLEDGTGGWVPTFPGSVVNGAALSSSHDTTPGTTTLYVMTSRDGGTTWFGGRLGGETSTTTTSGGEVLMADDISNPPEPLTTEDGTDWLYTG